MIKKLPIVIGAVMALALSAAAQTSEMQDLEKQWASLREALQSVESSMPEDRYSFRPSLHEPSFGELLLKMSEEISAQFAEITGEMSPFMRPNTLGAETVKKLAGDSFAYGAKAIGALKEADIDKARTHVLAAMTQAAATLGQAQAYVKAKDMVSADEADRRKFLFYGFLAAWLLVCLYVVAVSMRERRLRGELDRVKRLVEGQEQSEKIRL